MNNLMPIAFVAGIYLLVNSLKDIFGGKGSDDGSAGRIDDESKRTILALPTKDKSQKPTISEIQALTLANQQFAIMESAGSTDTFPNRKYNSKAILYALTDPLLGLNGKDLQMVYANFGLRLYSVVKLGSPNRVQRWLDKTSDLDLFGWYRHELNQNELNYIYTKVWSKTGLPPIGTKVVPMVKAVTTVNNATIYAQPSLTAAQVFKNIPLNSLVGFLSPMVNTVNNVSWQLLKSNAGNIIGWIPVNDIKAV